MNPCWAAMSRGRKHFTSAHPQNPQNPVLKVLRVTEVRAFPEAGPMWPLHGCRGAAYDAPSGSLTTYRENKKPVLGSLGDSWDGLQ
jgi:hypothetical protein